MAPFLWAADMRGASYRTLGEFLGRSYRFELPVHLLCPRPRQLSQIAIAVAERARTRIRCVAVEPAPVHACGDRREPEHRKDDENVERRRRVASGVAAVTLDERLLIGYAGTGQVLPGHTAGSGTREVGRQVVGQAGIAEVG